MEKHFKMTRLTQPHIKGELTLHSIYVLKHNLTGRLFRVRVTQVQSCIYNLNIIDGKDSPTEDWIQLSHEVYHTDYELHEAVSAKRSLDELSETFKPTSVSY